MEFKRCERCGCFFTSSDNICSNCLCKDNVDILKLKDYFNDNENIPSFESLSLSTGISEKNLIRYLQNNEFIENQNKIFE